MAPDLEESSETRNGERMGQTDQKAGDGVGQERRRETRFPVQFEVRFAASAQAARAFRAYSLNFSVGGLCLKTSRTYEVGEPLHLRMTVEGQQFEVEATVAWVRKGAIGVRFENLSEEEQARLEALKASLMQQA